MRRTSRFGVWLVALTLVASGCYGPFNLTRRLYQWNGQIGTKWEREFMFIILAWAPVYGIAVLGDGIVFNSMEFWTGKNPVDPPARNRSALPQTKRVARGEDEARLSYLPTSDGARLLVEQFRHGQPAGSLKIEQRDGVTVGLDERGKALFTAQSLADGSVLVHDGKGRQIAAYSADRVEQVMHSSSQ